MSEIKFHKNLICCILVTSIQALVCGCIYMCMLITRLDQYHIPMYTRNVLRLYKNHKCTYFTHTNGQKIVCVEHDNVNTSFHTLHFQFMRPQNFSHIKFPTILISKQS